MDEVLEFEEGGLEGEMGNEDCCVEGRTALALDKELFATADNIPFAFDIATRT